MQRIDQHGMSDKFTLSFQSVNFSHIHFFGQQWDWQVGKVFLVQKVLRADVFKFSSGFPFFFHRDVVVVVAEGCCALVVSFWRTRFLKYVASLKLSRLCCVCKCESNLHYEMLVRFICSSDLLFTYFQHPLLDTILFLFLRRDSISQHYKQNSLSVFYRRNGYSSLQNSGAFFFGRSGFYFLLGDRPY